MRKTALCCRILQSAAQKCHVRCTLCHCFCDLRPKNLRRHIGGILGVEHGKFLVILRDALSGCCIRHFHNGFRDVAALDASGTAQQIIDAACLAAFQFPDVLFRITRCAVSARFCVLDCVDIVQLVVLAVYQADGACSGFEMPVHAVACRPECEICASACVRSLCMDQDLLIERVLVHPRGSCEETCPRFLIPHQSLQRFRTKLLVLLVLCLHFCPPNSIVPH